jgi:hypothetical protein
MKEQIKEKPDIKEFIKQEPPIEDHSESFGFEGYRISFAAFAPFPSYYCYIAV